MKVVDMHCDTMIECWRHEDRSLRNGKGHLNLELMKENYSKNMRTLDEQMKIIEAKEELLRQEALLGKVAANP